MIGRYMELRSKGKVSLKKDDEKPEENKQVIMEVPKYDELTGELVGKKVEELGIATVDRRLEKLSDLKRTMQKDLDNVDDEIESLTALRYDIENLY